MDRPRSPDPLYFFAQHPRGIQQSWLEYWDYILFKDPFSIPSCAEAKVRCCVDAQDKDTDSCAYLHTRFHLGSDITNEDLPVIVTKIREHICTDLLQVAIFEDKFDEGLILNLHPSQFHEFLDQRVLQRLIRSLSFVKDVERAVDLIAKVKGARYNPESVHLSVTVTSDEINELWAKELHDWEVNDVLFNALKEIAKEAGRPKWVFGDADAEKEEYEAVFHLSVYFTLNRICVGIEIYEDSEIHPQLETAIQSFSGGLSSFIAHVINPEPHDIVLELNLTLTDFSMSTLYHYDCMYYAGVLTQELEVPSGHFDDPLDIWSQIKPTVMARDGKTGQREFEMIVYSDFTQLFAFEMLPLANRLFCYVDFDLFTSNETSLDDFYRGVLDVFGQTELDSTLTMVLPLNHYQLLVQATRDLSKGAQCVRSINVITLGRWITIVELRRFRPVENFDIIERLDSEFYEDNDDDDDDYYEFSCYY